MSSEELVSPILCPPSWPLVRLKDVAKKIGSGATPTGGQAAYQAARTGFALVRSQNVFDRAFSEAGLAFISDDQAEGLRNVRLQKDDLLLNITGDGVTFGRACKVPNNVLPACVNQHVSIIRLDQDRADSGYILSYLTHPLVKEYVEAFNAGGSRRAITKAHIESFVVPLPALETQKWISSTLAALDDRITLLRETNATLEAIAQALFKSWFVDFDPVRAKMEGRAPEGMDEATAALFPDGFEESELELVPKGWLPVRLDSFMELAYGKALKAEHREHGPVPVYGSGGITGWHSSSLVDHASVIVGRKGTVGSIYWESRPFYPIDTVFYVKSKLPLSYCHQVLKTLGLHGMNTDAAVPGLNRENVYRLLVPGASLPLIGAFDEIVRSLRAGIDRNEGQAQTLATLRDTLLPRLISGQLRLTDASSQSVKTRSGTLSSNSLV
ncbi:MAG: restriction endonuclease subunit S [Comamonadaceae bacterium]|nr:MAG: restriction endonuclease subunit S [Comamonadaceae bacterium]